MLRAECTSYFKSTSPGSYHLLPMQDHTSLQRALRILQRMSTHDRVTIEELYQLFDGEVTKRSLQRLMKSIEGANIPLTVEVGAHGEHHWSLHRNFDFIPIVLEPDELLAAILLGQFRELFAGTRIGESLERVYDRLEQIAPVDSVEMIDAFLNLRDGFAFHEPGKVDLRPAGPALLELFRALLLQRVCNVTYNGKQYPIHPYSLLLHRGAIYAVVFQPRHKNWIYLSLTKVAQLEVTNDVFERDQSFSLSEFLKSNFGLWRAEPELIEMKFSRTIRTSIEGRLWHSSQKILETVDGDIVLSMNVGVTEELIAWILRWGTYVQVLGPESLRKTLKERLHEMLSRYN